MAVDDPADRETDAPADETDARSHETDGSPPISESTDPRVGAPAVSAAALGHDRPDDPNYRTLAADLRDAVAGEVQFDEYAQVLYATDGSIYGARPAGVVLPRDVADVQAAVRVAAAHDVPILPRGAGSSLAGQAVGPGCVVVDCSRHMDEILEVRPEDRRAVVQPGVVQDALDDRLAEHGLQFAPDPASSARATIGGGIGNNSTGAHSVRYGITDAYTEELRVVLADGSLLHTRDVVLDSPEYERIVGKDDREAAIYETVRALVTEHEAEIDERYPELKRSVSGYNLHKVISETEAGETVINLSKLFVGAEGTLGVVVEAELSLVTKPEATALAVYCFDTLDAAMRAVPDALEHPVGAVELMDDEVFALAADSEEFSQYVEPIPDGTAAALMLEFDSELVDDFEAAIAETTTAFLAEGAAFDVIEAYTEAAQADLWKLRKAAIPLLMSLEGDAKPYPFIEDASVPPAELAAYVDAFEAILEDHDTSAAYFAHAGAGTLHVRPILSLKNEDGVETMHSITDAVTDLVLAHDGAFSGEHGDGLARTEFNPKLYGPALWGAFQELKSAFDPDWRMNPGKVVFVDGDTAAANGYPEPAADADMREHLRYGPAYQSVEPTTTLDFSEEGGFAHLVELCNGCGTCRERDSGGTMCPTFRASREEVQSTRGRANMLRAAISGELPEGEIHSDRFQEEVLDLCLGCKGCKRDCPTGVDLAKLKAEVKHRHHEKRGATLRECLFRDIDRLAALGSALAPLSNVATKVPGTRRLVEATIGVAADRDLPPFRRDDLRTWFDRRGGPAVNVDEAVGTVILFPDTYTTYSYPDPGKATVKVLEAAGYRVEVPPDLAPSGRAAYSTGFLDVARERAAANVDALAPRVADGASVVFVEPSDAVMFQDEYRDLLGGPAADAEVDPEDTKVDTVADAAYGVMEFLDVARVDDRLAFDAPDDRLTYHGHCNQKATNTDHHAVGVLRRAGYPVDPLDSGCCGMAGSFGYEAEHHALSRAIGRILFDQVDASDGDVVVAPGGSCRSQLGERDDAARQPPHPIEKVAEALVGPAD